MAWFQQKRTTNLCSELLFSTGHNLRTDKAVTSFVRRNELRVTKKPFSKCVSKWFTLEPIWLTWNYIFQILLCFLTPSQSWSEQKCEWDSEAITVRGVQREMRTPGCPPSPLLVISEPRSTVSLWDSSLPSMGYSASGRAPVFPYSHAGPSLFTFTSWGPASDFSQIDLTEDKLIIAW